MSDANDNSVVYHEQNVVFEKSVSYLHAFENSLADMQCLKYDYQDMILILDADKYSFVPISMFSPNFANDYFRFNYGNIPDNEGVFFSSVDVGDFNVIFSFDKIFIDFLENVFPNAQIIPKVSWYIDKVYAEGKNLMNAVYADVDDDKLIVVVFKSSKFVMANTYHFMSIEDAEYLLLKAYSAFELENSVPLYLHTKMEMSHIAGFVQNVNVI